MGFPKEKEGQRLKQIESFGTEHAYVFYVGNSKIEKFLSEIYKVWNNDATVFLAERNDKNSWAVLFWKCKWCSGRVKK